MAKRENARYPALNPRLNLKNRQDEINDVLSYADKLSAKDKKWLNDFMEGYVCANPKAKGSRRIFDTKAKRSVCWSKNNTRNDCEYTRARSRNNIIDAPPPEKPVGGADDVIADIDREMVLKAWGLK